MPLVMAGPEVKEETKKETEEEVNRLKKRAQDIYMFDGKNNRMLDSFYFRILVTLGVFLVWAGAGYVVLALA